jgi:hypothetical protein
MPKLPDSYVPDRSTKTYPTEIGSQKFSPDNVDLFRLEKTSRLKTHFTSKFAELQSQYDKLMEEIELNERLYSAKQNFNPSPGHLYHLYVDDRGEEFLSIISPDEWKKFQFLGTFRYLSDGRWEAV